MDNIHQKVPAVLTELEGLHKNCRFLHRRIVCIEESRVANPRIPTSQRWVGFSFLFGLITAGYRWGYNLLLDLNASVTTKIVHRKIDLNNASVPIC